MIQIDSSYSSNKESIILKIMYFIDSFDQKVKKETNRLYLSMILDC